jgi:HAMP domain-containing protein
MAEEETTPRSSEELRQEINRMVSELRTFFREADIEDSFIWCNMSARLDELERLLKLANIELTG